VVRRYSGDPGYDLESLSGFNTPSQEAYRLNESGAALVSRRKLPVLGKRFVLGVFPGFGFAAGGCPFGDIGEAIGAADGCGARACWSFSSCSKRDIKSGLILRR